MGQGVGSHREGGIHGEGDRGGGIHGDGDRGGGIHWNVYRGRDTGEGDIGEGV